MEAVQLLSFTLAIITVSLAQHRRRRSTARSLRQPTIKIRGAVARRALINQANVSIYCLVDILINRHKTMWFLDWKCPNKHVNKDTCKK